MQFINIFKTIIFSDFEFISKIRKKKKYSNVNRSIILLEIIFFANLTSFK